MFLKISVRILAREASEVPLMTPPTTTTTTIAGWNILKVDQEALGNSYCSHIKVSDHLRGHHVSLAAPEGSLVSKL